jgi:hypothetical protein
MKGVLKVRFELGFEISYEFVIISNDFLVFSFSFVLINNSLTCL